MGSNGGVLDGEIRWETLRWFALVLGFGRCFFFLKDGECFEQCFISNEQWYSPYF